MPPDWKRQPMTPEQTWLETVQDNNNNNNNNNNSVISVNIQRFNSVLLHDSFAEDVPVM